MITIKPTFEKNAFYKKQTETTLLIEIEAPAKVDKQTKTNKLNLSIAIDISGSMSSPVKSRGIGHFNSGIVNHPTLGGIAHAGLGFPHNQPVHELSISKLDQAKRAAKKAIDSMRNGDFISIVAFDDVVDVLVSATELTQSNRDSIKSKIDSLRVRGMTNIHGGWHRAATEVAKNIGAKSINRVILLTDGQTNAGITNPDEICTNVLTMKNSAISTSTFGIGEQFNEDLLQGMANAGDGNAYYINDDEKLEKMFKDEFQGLSNIYATDIKAHFAFNEGYSVKEQLNNLIVDNDKYSVSNLISEGKNSLLFKLNLDLGKNATVGNVGTFTLSYKDSEGSPVSISVEISNEVVSKKKWDSLEDNKEVKVQETLMTIANNKLAVTKAIDNNDMVYAKELLGRSMVMAASASMSFADDRLSSETNSLQNSILNADKMNAQAFRKDMAYESYATRTGKKDS